MFASVKCPACEFKFSVLEAGKRQICPNCQSPFVAGKSGEEAAPSPAAKPAALNKTMIGETPAPVSPPNLNKTLLAADETTPAPTSFQSGAPIPAVKISPARTRTAPSRPTVSRPSGGSRRGLWIGAGLMAGGFLFVILLTCVVSIFIFLGKRKATADAIAQLQEEKEAAQRWAEQQQRDADRNRAEAEQRRAEQQRLDFEQALAQAAEAKRRAKQDELDRLARDQEQRKRLAAEQQALRDQQAKLTKELKGGANKKGALNFPPPDFQVNGVLTAAQGNPRRPGCFCEVHTFAMKAGQTYDIGLFAAWDNYLHLENPFGDLLASDDDGGGFPNARIVFTCPADGTYRIIVTSFPTGITGPYTLRVRS